MSDQLPPNVNIFSGINYNSQFFNNTSGSLTYNQAKDLFLTYPSAQGNELTNYNLTINGDLISSSAVSFTSSNAPISSQTLLPSNENSNKIPTTAWVQSILTNAGSVYSRIYTTSQTITIPANCRSIDLFLQGQGGLAGTTDGTYYGGMGSGGNQVILNGMPISPGESLTLTISTSTSVIFNGSTILQALGGLNGQNFQINTNRSGGASNTTTGTIDTTLGAVYTTFGNAGSGSTSNGTMMPSIVGTVGCPKGVSQWVDGGYGMGQAEEFGQIGPGYVLITYHLGV